MQGSPLARELARFKGDWPNASLDLLDNGSALIQMKYLLDGSYNEIRIAEQFSLQISVPASYPLEVPTVNEVDGIISPNYEHRLTDGSFCLGASIELLRNIQEDPSLSSFLEGPVQSYLYTALFWQRYGRYPYGDRAHGIQGIIQAYQDIFGLGETENPLPLMQYIANGNYRGHLTCPCESGRRIRNCHGTILLELINGPLKEVVSRDLETIQQVAVALSKRKQLLTPSLSFLLG